MDTDLDRLPRPWSLEGQRIEVRNIVDDDVPTMDVGLAWKRDANLSPAARAFCEYLSQSFNSSRQLFES